jgi:hypothetical protein
MTGAKDACGAQVKVVTLWLYEVVVGNALHEIAVDLVVLPSREGERRRQTTEGLTVQGGQSLDQQGRQSPVSTYAPKARLVPTFRKRHFFQPPDLWILPAKLASDVNRKI